MGMNLYGIDNLEGLSGVMSWLYDICKDSRKWRDSW
jgi:hypothetical protein